jgi:hypothetical protein
MSELGNVTIGKGLCTPWHCICRSTPEFIMSDAAKDLLSEHLQHLQGCLDSLAAWREPKTPFPTRSIPNTVKSDRQQSSLLRFGGFSGRLGARLPPRIPGDVTYQLWYISFYPVSYHGTSLFFLFFSLDGPSKDVPRFKPWYYPLSVRDGFSNKEKKSLDHRRSLESRS